MNKAQLEHYLTLSFSELVYIASLIKQKECGRILDLCTIMNARSGACSEDCKFCAQSSFHHTQIMQYPLASNEEIITAAKRAKEIGAKRFGIVTSGNSLSESEIKRIADVIHILTIEVGIGVCASLGALEKETLLLFKNAGLVRYHHNIETSQRFYPNIVSTHSFQERVETIHNAKEAGLEVCSGGIIGLGETWEDRIDMLLTLKDLEVDSVPLNVLIPIPGTPLENATPISPVDVIKTIAIFRIALKDKVIKIAAGRETILKDFQALAFMAGANGMLVGGYLTVKGRDVSEDQKLVEALGDF